MSCKCVDPSQEPRGDAPSAEEGCPVAQALAIKDGKYVYVGDEAGAAAYIQDGVTKVIDGKDKVLIGKIDGGVLELD